MTYVVKHKPQAGAPMICEYDCAACEYRLEVLVTRDDRGDPPELVECDVCGGDATLCISSPSIKRWSAAWTPINPPGSTLHEKDGDPRALKTEDLATGKITKQQWQARQREDRKRRWHEKKIKLGLTSRKIQVG